MKNGKEMTDIRRRVENGSETEIDGLNIINQEKSNIIECASITVSKGGWKQLHNPRV